jgi:hypothetical protein
VTLSGGALAGLLGQQAAAASVPVPLADAVVEAAGAVALGAPVSSLVSAQAVHLSEGVMRMMLVTKLKAVGAVALTVLALTGGLGFGLVPARAGDDPAKTAVNPSAGKQAAGEAEARPVDDAAYLNRLCLDLRGTPATVLEQLFFAADPDANKRDKVIDWLVADEAVTAHLAKQLNVSADRVRVVRVKGGPGAPGGLLVLVAKPDEGRYLMTVIDRSKSMTGGDTLYLDVTSDVKETNTGAFLFATGQNGNGGLSGAVVLNETVARRVEAYWIDEPGVEVLVWDVKSGKRVRTFLRVMTDGQPQQDGLRDLSYWLVAEQPETVYLNSRLEVADSDADFLRRVLTSARGTPPTAVEEKYFSEDKDPRKREKLLDTLLKDPAVAKKLGDDWKKQMLAPPPVQTLKYRAVVTEYYTGRVRWQVADPQAERLAKLVDTLLAAKKPDDQVLDGLTLTVVGRLPTDGEKSLALSAVDKATDKRAAWIDVATALAATDEAKKHAEALKGPAKP